MDGVCFTRKERENKMKIYDLSCTLEQGLWYYGTPYVPYDTKELATLKDNG